MTTSGMKVEFYRHNLGANEKQRVIDVLDGLVLTTGGTVREVEEQLGAYLDVANVVALDSCTAALHLALTGLGIGPGDEVIVPAMTFVATANAVIMAGATPVFVDVEERTGCIDVHAIRRAVTVRTRAIMPVHLYGLLCDMRGIRRIADEHDLRIVEDSAHCLEAARGDVRPGTHSDAACFSFYATKSLTSAEGGALVTHDVELARRVRELSLHGMSTSAYDRYSREYEHWDMPDFGWKYNLDNLRAALLSPQIALLDERCEARRRIAERYETAFREVKGVDFPLVAERDWSARHLFTIWVDPLLRDAKLKSIQSAGVGVAVNYRAVHLMKFYRREYGHTEGQFPVAERIGSSTISLPLYPKLTDAEVSYVIDVVSSVARGRAVERDDTTVRRSVTSASGAGA